MQNYFNIWRDFIPSLCCLLYIVWVIINAYLIQLELGGPLHFTLFYLLPTCILPPTLCLIPHPLTPDSAWLSVMLEHHNQQHMYPMCSLHYGFRKERFWHQQNSFRIHSAPELPMTIPLRDPPGISLSQPCHLMWNHSRDTSICFPQGWSLNRAVTDAVKSAEISRDTSICVPPGCSFSRGSVWEYILYIKCYRNCCNGSITEFARLYIFWNTCLL